MKDGAEGDVIMSRLEQVDLGIDEDGEPVNSCVVVPVEGSPVRAQAKRKLSDRQQLAIDALNEALATSGKAPPAGLQLPATTIAVPIETWRTEVFARGAIDKNAANPREDFSRVRNQLHARHIIGIRNDFVWMVP
jgi:hypothetical protein